MEDCISPQDKNKNLGHDYFFNGNKKIIEIHKSGFCVNLKLLSFFAISFHLMWTSKSFAHMQTCVKMST